jgi:hypothetical protein
MSMQSETIRRAAAGAFHNVTGGQVQRQTVELIHLHQDRRQFRYGACMDVTAGGPIDAPAYLPCGASTSLYCADGMGRPLPHQIETPRED